MELIDFQVVPKTRPGAYTRDEIDLNSPVQVFVRKRRLQATKRFSALEALIAKAKREGKPLPSDLEQQIQDIKASLLPMTPSDAPASCICDVPAARRKRR